MRKRSKKVNKLEIYDYWNMKRDPHWMNGEGFWWDHCKGHPSENRFIRQYSFFKNMNVRYKGSE